MSRFMNRIAPGSPPQNVRVHSALWWTVGLWAAVQLATDLAGMGLLPRLFQQWEIYLRFAFFTVRFDQALAGAGVEPQLLWSFVTHAFLHAGWLHLAMNAALFLAIGHGLSHEAGIRATLLVFLGTCAAGALTFGLLTATQGALVGASGGTSGFLGVLLCWRERWLARQGASRDPIWILVGALVAINVMMAFGIEGGAIAWEAHLGGFVAGWLMAYAVPPRRHRTRNRARFL
ncbi:MAG: rhomboid family intramembrane serine protease [Pseudomonadota bacterium]